MSDIEKLRRTIVTVEGQRASLGDATVDPVLEGLRQQLAALEAEDQQRELQLEEQMSGGDRRIVSVLYCDVKSSTTWAERLDPELWTEIMDEAFDLFTEPIDRFGGNVAQLLGDGMVAFFGAMTAHEDDPLRAVLAGMALIENIQPLRQKLLRRFGMDFNVRIGIHTGLVVTTRTGTSRNLEFQAIGEGVTTAGIMEKTAVPGTVHVSEHTYRLTAIHFDFEEAETVALPGKERSVRTYRVLRHREPKAKRSGLNPYGITFPLTGREAEMKAGWAAVTRLLFGRGGFLHFSGDAGVGKSRLVAELQQRSQGPDLIWLSGRSLSSGQNISYRPFQEMLRQYADITDEDGEEAAWQKLERAVRVLFPQQIAGILPYLAGILALDVPPAYADRVQFLDGEAMRDQVLVASRRFWERLAESRPIVLVIEDLQWLDASSALLLERLLPLLGTNRLLLIGLSRPELNPEAEQFLGTAAANFNDQYSRVTLEPLSEGASRKLVATLLEDDDQTARAQEMIVRIAGGNPFFMEELLRDLIEEGAITPGGEGGRWRATQRIETLHIPETVQGVITARIDRLEDGPRRVLRAAAVIGPTFRRRVLAAVLESEQLLDEHLALLQTAELIDPLPDEAEESYYFNSALAQEVTYESTLLLKRRQLHLKVGQVMETLYADRLEEFYGFLAYHYVQAEAWEQAQNYLLKAGDQAGFLAAGAEALNQYQRALQAYENAFGPVWNALQRAEVERKIGEAYYGLGRLPESREYFQRALELLDRSLPRSRSELYRGLVRQVGRQILHRVLPGRFIGRADAEQAEAMREAVRSYERLGVISYIQGEAATSVYTFLRSLNLAEPAGSSPELARAYANNIVATSMIPPLRFLSARYSKLALETARQGDDLASLAWVLELTGIYHTGIGEWTEAVAAAENAVDINQRIGRLRWWEESMGILSQALHYTGRFARSRKTYEQFYVSGKARGDAQTQFWALTGQAETSLRLEGAEHLDEILSLLEQAQALINEYRYPNRPDEIQLNGLLALVQLRRRDYEAAWSAAQRAHDLIGKEWPPNTFYSFEAYSALPAVYLGLWWAQEERAFTGTKPENLPERARQACRDLRNFARVFPFAWPRATLWLGYYEWRRNNQKQARQLWQKALKRAQRLEMPFDAGLAYYAIGRHIAPGDPAREQMLQQAVDIFTDLSAAWDLERAQVELEAQ